ncbi:MAG: peptide deformylase [Candidatus Margulisbacteria bacterium]|jgi:peptide deformylase|nr:peptide deformylase [Candidatus Margulisiibacteriota bacterium]
MILKILQYPDPLLREKSVKIARLTPGLKTLALDMLETLYSVGNGVGLAAPQVGKLYRLFVYDISVDRNEPGVLFNPELLSHNNQKTKRAEGCLSCRNFEGLVERYTKVTVRGVNLDGKTVTIKAADFLARVFQHEIEHLDGIVILDKAEPVPPDSADTETEIV